jgi:hypothetical protein
MAYREVRPSVGGGSITVLTGEELPQDRPLKPWYEAVKAAGGFHGQGGNDFVANTETGVFGMGYGVHIFFAFREAFRAALEAGKISPEQRALAKRKDNISCLIGGNNGQTEEAKTAEGIRYGIVDVLSKEVTFFQPTSSSEF